MPFYQFLMVAFFIFKIHQKFIRHALLVFYFRWWYVFLLATDTVLQSARMENCTHGVKEILEDWVCSSCC